MLRRLRIKFVCIMMSVVTVMLCVIFGLVIFFTSQGLEWQGQRMLQSAASEPALPARPGEAPQETRQLPYLVVQLGRRGEILSASGGYAASLEEQTLQQIVQEALASEKQTGILRDHDLRFLKRNRASGQVLVFSDISHERTAMRMLIKSCGVIAVISLGVFLGLSVLLAGWAVRPVEQAWNQQKQFVADASHELKTPLTVIMTNAELLQSGEYSDSSRQQFSESILTMSQQMRRLVEGLLELARVDNGAVKTGFSEVDISGLVSEGILPFEPLFFEKELTLSTVVEPGIHLRGSAAHLRQVLDILLDNAMKYSAAPGEVRVKLKRQGSHCLLSVASPGGEISREDLRNIFKRFYRIDKARSRDGSYGLGLSIAQSIVEEHRGKIWAESENGTNTFCVQLPLGG